MHVCVCTQVSQNQKGKTNLYFTEARDSEWQCHQLDANLHLLTSCKFAPHPRQVTTPASHHSVFSGRMLFLSPNEQHESLREYKNIQYADLEQKQQAEGTKRIPSHLVTTDKSYMH